MKIGIMAHCRSVVQTLVVRVGDCCTVMVSEATFLSAGGRCVTYEDITPQYRRTVFQLLIVRLDFRAVTYEAMTPIVGGRPNINGRSRLSGWMQDW